jgi:hypothetical protein
LQATTWTQDWQSAPFSVGTGGGELAGSGPSAPLATPSRLSASTGTTPSQPEAQAGNGPGLHHTGADRDSDCAGPGLPLVAVTTASGTVGAQAPSSYWQAPTSSPGYFSTASVVFAMEALGVAGDKIDAVARTLVEEASPSVSAHHLVSVLSAAGVGARDIIKIQHQLLQLEGPAGTTNHPSRLRTGVPGAAGYVGAIATGSSTQWQPHWQPEVRVLSEYPDIQGDIPVARAMMPIVTVAVGLRVRRASGFSDSESET